MDIIILTTYTGNLIAFLTITKVSLPVNNLEELASQTTHKVGVLGDSSHEAVFKVKNQLALNSDIFCPSLLNCIVNLTWHFCPVTLELLT